MQMFFSHFELKMREKYEVLGSNSVSGAASCAKLQNKAPVAKFYTTPSTPKNTLLEVGIV